jgi:hypothetical protein
MAPKTDYIVVDPDGLCPCRSGKITVVCCMAADGSFRVKFPPPLPSGDITGFSHANCYMRDTHNCSANAATGYYFSNGLRELLRTHVVAVTFPWDEAGKDMVPGIEDLPAGLLCDRHYAALAPLDAVAIQAFRNILDGVAYVTMKSLATKTTLAAVSGEGLELWLLKILFGAYHNALAADGDSPPRNFLPLDTNIFEGALRSRALAAPRGLYVRRYQTAGEPVHASTNHPKRIAGLYFKIGPLEFELVVDPDGLDIEAVRNRNFYRPSGIDLIGKKRNAQVHMSGLAFATNETARLALSDMLG